MDALLLDLDNTLITWDVPIRYHVIVSFLKAMKVKDPEKFYSSHWHDAEDRLANLIISAEDYMTVCRPLFLHTIAKTKEELTLNHAHLAPGALKVLRRAKAPKALVSNSLAETVHFTLKHFQIDRYFDYVYERDYYNENEHKPKQVVADKVCAALGVEASKDVLMLGDSMTDIKFANDSGLTSVAIGTYYDEADHYYPNLDEFARYMRRF